MAKGIKKKESDCHDIAKSYIDHKIATMNTRIDTIDKRDMMQYETAKKIIMDMHTVLTNKVDDSSAQVVAVKKELDHLANTQAKQMETLGCSLTAINTKLDDISQNGTVQAREIKDSLSHINVNGGTYGLKEALQYMSDQHKETHIKLDEVAKLTEGIAARKKWFKATSDLIDKDGPWKFFLKSKLGFFMFVTIIIVIFNTITHALGWEFDILSILTWAANIISKVLSFPK